MEAKQPSKEFITRLAGLAVVAALVLATTSIAQVGRSAQPATSFTVTALPPETAPPPPAQAQQPAPAQAAQPAPARPAQPMPGQVAPPAPGQMAPPAPGQMAPAAANKGAFGRTIKGAATKLLPSPALEPGEEGLAITLPAALKLANAQSWDIIIATQQLRIAEAQLQGANVLWLPNIQAGVDYQYHSGPIQNSDGTISNPANHSNIYTGAAPLAIFAIGDAIFTPLAQRQVVRAQDANIQTSTNDTLTNMAEVYFDLMEAQSELAGIIDVDQRAGELVRVTQALVEIIPEAELSRIKANKANMDQVVETARNRWRNASAEVDRVTRLKPTVVLEPLEPAELRMTLVPLHLTPNELIAVGVANRPELTFQQAQAEAARERMRQEKWRPFLPTVVLRGGGTTPPDAFAVGAYGGGQNGALDNFGLRTDWDVGAYWELRNLGFGNRALIRQRHQEYDLALSQEYRFQDLVAREVMQAWADVRSADRRLASVERELREAEFLAEKDVNNIGQVKRLGNVNILVITPLEAVTALQALQTAYFDYFGVVQDYNRAQFRLYRAIGSPAQFLLNRAGIGGPPLPPEMVAPMPQAGAKNPIPNPAPAPARAPAPAPAAALPPPVLAPVRVSNVAGAGQ